MSLGGEGSDTFVFRELSGNADSVIVRVVASATGTKSDLRSLTIYVMNMNEGLAKWIELNGPMLLSS